MLRTNRGLLKTILLSIITFGIYGLVLMSNISEEINIIATKRDSKHTMHYCLLFFIATPLTLGLATLVWYHRICDRIGHELRTRNLPYYFTSTDFWVYDILGCFYIIGPFIFLYKFLKAMNILNADYNTNKE